jgi:hypothetical protein
MTRIIKKPSARTEPIGRPDLSASQPATLSARDPLAYAAALKILG